DGTSNTLVYNTFLGGSWGPKRTITNGPGGSAQTSAAQPGMAAYQGTLHLVHVGPASTYGDIFWSTFDGSGWTAELTIPNHQSQGTPAIASRTGQLMMVHLGVEAPNEDGGNIWHSYYQ